MNVLLLSASAATRQWLECALMTFIDEPEINVCDSVDFGLRVLQVDGDVQVVVIDADLVPCEVAPAIKALWRGCRSATLVVAATAPGRAEMVTCVNAGALGYVPRSLSPQDFGKVLTHVTGGSLWVPDLGRRTP